jgi:hypothetical protein
VSLRTLFHQSLSSLRSTFGELGDLHPERPSEQDLGRVSPGPLPTFPTSPATSLGHSFSLDTNPPSSPPDGHRALSPQSASTPATSASINSTSITDRMSSDEIRHPQPISGSYACTVTGCSVDPFKTQYLLNSHMNVHSSTRPHYCQVKGCPRSAGGKGFKRENELKRHGLTHNSPGYYCPFCPVEKVKHKYPRRDNLKRYVDLQVDACAATKYAFWNSGSDTYGF